MGGPWSEKARKSFQEKRKGWVAGRRALSDEERSERGLDQGNWKQRNPKRHAALACEYRARHPEKIRAQNALNYAIRKGKIKRQPCEDCGTKRRVQAHHISYYPKDWYNVDWLCHRCHNRRHLAEGMKPGLSSRKT